MNFCQRLLQHYITSWVYFEDPVYYFWIMNHFRGECEIKLFSENSQEVQQKDCGEKESERFCFESESYRKYKKRMERGGAYTFMLDAETAMLLDAETTMAYFSEIEDDDILFMVIFAHWLQLPAKQIRHIRSAKKTTTATKRLVEHLLDRDAAYYIIFEDGEKLAKRVGSTLVTDDGTVYQFI